MTTSILEKDFDPQCNHSNTTTNAATAVFHSVACYMVREKSSIRS